MYYLIAFLSGVIVGIVIITGVAIFAIGYKAGDGKIE
jgi:hypothetical protein